MLIFILLDINHISREVIDINSFSIDMKFCKSKLFSHFILSHSLYVVVYSSKMKRRIGRVLIYKIVGWLFVFWA